MKHFNKIGIVQFKFKIEKEMQKPFRMTKSTFERKKGFVSIRDFNLSS